MIFIFLFLLSVFCIIYYGIVIAYSGLRTSFVWFWPFSAIMAALTAIILQSDFYMSLPSIIHSIIKVFLVLILAFFLILLFKIWKASHESKSMIKNIDYLIVPGAIVRGDRPSDTLLSRIQITFDYLSVHPKTVAILTGYQNKGANLSQGKCMQKELRNMGIPAYRLLVEGYARTTEENLKFSKEFMTLSAPTVGVITNDFHLYRTLKLSKKYGYKKIIGIACKTPFPILLHCLVRELFAIIKSFLH